MYTCYPSTVYILKLKLSSNIGGGMCMEELYEELKKELNLKEKLVYKIFKKDLEKIYNRIRIKIVNSMID